MKLRCPSEAGVLAFVRRALDKNERRRIEEHMAACEECRRLISCLARLQR